MVCQASRASLTNNHPWHWDSHSLPLSSWGVSFPTHMWYLWGLNPLAIVLTTHFSIWLTQPQWDGWKYHFTRWSPAQCWISVSVQWLPHHYWLSMAPIHNANWLRPPTMALPVAHLHENAYKKPVSESTQKRAYLHPSITDIGPMKFICQSHLDRLIYVHALRGHPFFKALIGNRIHIFKQHAKYQNISQECQQP